MLKNDLLEWNKKLLDENNRLKDILEDCEKRSKDKSIKLIEIVSLVEKWNIKARVIDLTGE